MQGDTTISWSDLLDGLISVLTRDDLTEKEKTAVERALYLLSTD